MTDDLIFKDRFGNLSRPKFFDGKIKIVTDVVCWHDGTKVNGEEEDIIKVNKKVLQMIVDMMPED